MIFDVEASQGIGVARCSRRPLAARSLSDYVIDSSEIGQACLGSRGGTNTALPPGDLFSAAVQNLDIFYTISISGYI
jgi:hypothetical protein